MVLQIEEKLFQDMSRELLANLGYHIIKEELVDHINEYLGA